MNEWRCTCKRETGSEASCPAHGGAAPVTLRDLGKPLGLGSPAVQAARQRAAKSAIVRTREATA